MLLVAVRCNKGVGIHRFAGPAEAAAAADYIAQDVAAESGASLEFGPAIGDGSMLLTGQNENGRWANLMVYAGPYVVSVSASSPEGDPVGPVVAIGQSVLANSGFSS